MVPLAEIEAIEPFGRATVDPESVLKRQALALASAAACSSNDLGFVLYHLFLYGSGNYLFVDS